jgi:hypothetical protein
MFRFLARRKKRLAAEKATRIANAEAAVHEKLTSEIAMIVAEAIADSEIAPEDAQHLAARAEALQRGVDLVLLKGHDAFGLALATADKPTRLGAMLAHGAVNLTLVTGTLEHPDSVADIRHGLGLPLT